MFSHSSFALCCFALINGIALFYFDCFPNFNYSLPEFNKATIISIHNKLNLFFMVLLFLLFFILIGYLLWISLSIIISSENHVGKGFFVIVTLICFVVVLWIYFSVVYLILMDYFKKNEVDVKKEEEKFVIRYVCTNGGRDCHYVT
ncbi:unnamed protein product [Meloidogyne enterolobii]|uniref:Uncharacterized protein n=1 Tax=Meloidogyne enterolobii TaxID=390850 RepID=A0ACB1AWK2_MELEN